MWRHGAAAAAAEHRREYVQCVSGGLIQLGLRRRGGVKTTPGKRVVECQ